MAQSVVGIDVSKATLDICYLFSSNVHTGHFANDSKGHRAVHKWLMRQCKGQLPHVCLEATGQYGEAIAEFLHERDYPVSVVNPARIKSYARSLMRRNKTDKADAQVIADFCLKQEPDVWSPLPTHLKDLKSLVRRLEGLKNNRQQERNRLQSGVDVEWIVSDLREHIAYLDVKITALEKVIHQHINQYPELKKQRDLLDTIPGIGKLTAAKILAEVPRITEFDDARQLAAYAGLTPRNVLSGTSVRGRTRLCKTGNAHLRLALYMPAIVAKTWNPIVKTFYERMLNNGLCKMGAIAASMRKLLHIVYGVLKSGRPFDPNYLGT